MLKRAALLIVCLVCMAAGNGLAQEKVLINGIDANYPPFAYVDQSGKPSGFDVDAIPSSFRKFGRNNLQQTCFCCPCSWWNVSLFQEDDREEMQLYRDFSAPRTLL